VIVTQKTVIEILSDNSVPLTARVVYVKLVDYCTRERGCFPGEQRIADDLSLSLRTVRRALRELIDMAWIKCTHRGATKTNVYALNRYVDGLEVTGQNDPSHARQAVKMTGHDGSKRPVMTGQNDRQTKLEERNKEELPTGTIVPVAPPPEIPKPKSKASEKPAPANYVLMSKFHQLRGTEIPARDSTSFGTEITQASRLVKDGVTADDLPALIEHASTWAKRGITLGVLVSDVAQWRDSTNGKVQPTKSKNERVFDEFYRMMGKPRDGAATVSDVFEAQGRVVS